VLRILLDQGGTRSGILSAFSLDLFRGSVYVEAKGLLDVQLAVRGVSCVLHALGAPRIELVSEEDCVSLLAIMARDDTHPVQPSSWVRIKKPRRLNGRLALVTELDLPNRLAVVCFPRTRPLKRRWGDPAPSDPAMEEESIKLSNLSIKRVNFLPQELFQFRRSIDDFVKQALANEALYLRIEDRVLVASGPLRGLEGCISEIHGDGTISIVSSAVQERNLPIILSACDVCRKFLPGDDVSILSGESEGQRGFITAVKGGSAFLYLPNEPEKEVG
jgi:ribosomal protein L24